MGQTTTCFTKRKDARRDGGGLGRYWLEAMAGVVAMFAQREAYHAQIVVGTVCAGNQLLTRNFCSNISRRTAPTESHLLTVDARVASTRSILGSGHLLCLGVNRLRLRLPLLGGDGFGDTGD